MPDICDQQQEEQDQGPPQQASSQYNPQAGYEGEPSMYDYDQSVQRPTSRGSKSGADDMYGHGAEYTDHYSHAMSHEQDTYSAGGMHEEEEEMW